MNRKEDRPAVRFSKEPEVVVIRDTRDQVIKDTPKRERSLTSGVGKNKKGK